MSDSHGSAVAIGMGSNLGEPLDNLRFGWRGLRALLGGVEASSIYETVPLHVADQPQFLNACCIGRTCLTPRDLMSELQHIENLAGRDRGAARFGPRTLDLDLLLYGEDTVCEPGLVVPHPRLRERAFVLVPLREIAADWRVPRGEATPAGSVAELADAIGAEGVVRTNWRLEED